MLKVRRERDSWKLFNSIWQITLDAKKVSFVVGLPDSLPHAIFFTISIQFAVAEACFEKYKMYRFVLVFMHRHGIAKCMYSPANTIFNPISLFKYVLHLYSSNTESYSNSLIQLRKHTWLCSYPLNKYN